MIPMMIEATIAVDRITAALEKIEDQVYEWDKVYQEKVLPYLIHGCILVLELVAQICIMFWKVSVWVFFRVKEMCDRVEEVGSKEVLMLPEFSSYEPYEHRMIRRLDRIAARQAERWIVNDVFYMGGKGKRRKNRKCY